MSKQIKTVGIISLLISSIIVISSPLLADLTRGQSSPSLGWSANYDYQVGDFPEHFAIGDIDTDGDLDLVVSNLFSDTVTVYFNSGKGKFINRTDFITGTSGDGPRCVALADVNEDNNNDLDILVANYYAGNLTVLTNNGIGEFSQPINYAGLKDPTCIKVADINGDSYIDIIVNNYFENKIGVMLNNGTGAFQVTNNYTVGTHPGSFCILDIDGDNDIDIISADLLDDTITVYTNNGSGNFTYFDKYSTDNGPRGITSGDLDNDGDLDIVITNRHADSITVMKNRGDGNFSERYDYPCGDTALVPAIGDLDGDGDNDIGVICLGDDMLRIFNNSGTGNFSEYYDIVLLLSGPYWIEIVDLDKDYDNDMVISSAYEDKIFTIFKDFPPDIVIMEPDGVDDVADLTYSIKWLGTDPDENNILSVDLFYCMPITEGEEGTEYVLSIPIVFGTENDGIYEWDCSLVDNGSYQLAATIYDDYGNYHSVASKYNVTITHNVPPKLIILNPPDGDEIYAHTSITIRWADSDPDDNAVINISYDNDNNSANGNMGRLVTERSEDKDGDNDKFKWKTSAVPEGEYYIVFEITDGHRDNIIIYSDGKVLVNHGPPNDPPEITILEPDGVDDIAVTTYLITWLDSDEDDDAEITLYYDDDDADFDGIEIIDGIMEDDDSKAPDGTEINMYVWNFTMMVSDGDYYIYGKIEDDLNPPYFNYSSGPITIQQTTICEEPVPPKAVISSPAPGGIFSVAEKIRFDGTESEGKSLTYFWSSNLGGKLGSTSSFEMVLEEGTHIITLTVTDSEGAFDSTSIYLYIFNIPNINSTDIDSDNDTYNDTYEMSKGTDPFDNTSYPLDTDGDGIFDYLDHDDDNDGYNDSMEWPFGTNPLDPNSTPPDLDDDFLPDSLDPDIDGDNVPNEDDDYPYDKSRSKKKKVIDNTIILFSLIGIVIIIILFVALFLFVRKQKQDERAKQKDIPSRYSMELQEPAAAQPAEPQQQVVPQVNGPSIKAPEENVVE